MSHKIKRNAHTLIVFTYLFIFWKSENIKHSMCLFIPVGGSKVQLFIFYKKIRSQNYTKFEKYLNDECFMTVPFLSK